MTATRSDFRDYIRVAFSRGWWFAFVTLGVVAGISYYSFVRATKYYVARNEILVTDKYAGSLPKEIASSTDWITRIRKAELDFKRPVPARQTIEEAVGAVRMTLSESDVLSMVDSFKDKMKLEYSKEGGFIRLSYEASDGRLAAAVLSLFVKRVLASAVELQVQELNTEVSTLTALRDSLASQVAASERRLDEMKTVAPELKLTASTMAMLKDSRDIKTMPSTEQAVAVFLQLQRDIIGIDSDIADICEQMTTIAGQIKEQPDVVPAKRKLETMPAVVEATRRRDALRVQLAQLLANSTADHPMVKEIQAELKSLDAFLVSAASEATVEVVYEANQVREQLKVKATQLESEAAGLKERRVKLEENKEQWRKKLDEMPAQWRTARELTLDYEKKTDNLSLVTDDLVQAQIRRGLALDQVGTYYQPQWELTPVPERYTKPNHIIHLMLGVVLGLLMSFFAVYVMEFADHSVKDQRDLRAYTKAAVLGVISDYNQLKAVARRTPFAKAAILKTYLLALAFVALAGVVAWADWRWWPAPQKGQTLPAALSSATVSNIEQAMKLYTSQAANLEDYRSAEGAKVEVTPAIEVPGESSPQPMLSE